MATIGTVIPGSGFNSGNGLPSSVGGGGLNFGAGTTALGALSGGLQLGQSIASDDAMGSASGALKLGSLIPGIGTAFAVASFGLDLANMFMPNPALEQQAYNEAYSLTMQKFQIEERNRQRQEMYQRQLDMVKDQIDANAIAAWDSWTSEQTRLNEVYDQAAFLSQGMLKELVETQGQAAAREVYGKSARRGALVSTLGNYGRSRAQLTKQLVSETTETARRMTSTYNSLKIANERALASVATAPMMEMVPQMSYTDFTPSPLAQGLMIGQSAIGAGMSGWDLTPAGDTFFGITKPA